MFVSRHDALMTVLLAAYAARPGAVGGAPAGALALGDLDAVRATLAAVGETAGATCAPASSGDDEIARLGRASTR